jgi:hypothetical protein
VALLFVGVASALRESITLGDKHRIRRSLADLRTEPSALWKG